MPTQEDSMNYSLLFASIIAVIVGSAGCVSRHPHPNPNPSTSGRQSDTMVADSILVRYTELGGVWTASQVTVHVRWIDARGSARMGTIRVEPIQIAPAALPSRPPLGKEELG